MINQYRLILTLGIYKEELAIYNVKNTVLLVKDTTCNYRARHLFNLNNSGFHIS